MTKYKDLFDSITKMIRAIEEVYDVAMDIDDGEILTSINYPFTEDLQTAIFNARCWRDDVKDNINAAINGDS